MYIKRAIKLRRELESKSFFLFGPRQTGKTSLIREQFGGCKTYNLLDSGTYRRLQHAPETLNQELKPDDQIVVIDEIQKIPELLNEVQLAIEEKGINFLLTGSSARSLRRKGVNLLGGRARSVGLFPFTYKELGKRFDLLKATRYGLVPSIYLSNEPEEDLKAYADDYLKEEIAAEALVRNIGAFSRFLEIAALCHGQMINYTKVGNDAQVHPNTVREYFGILEDTLIGTQLTPFAKTKKRKAVATAKFYFFDIGLARYLQGRKGLSARSPEFGEAFESFIFQELRAYCSYHRVEELNYWRSKSKLEVDFILGGATAIEVKAKPHISNNDLKGLNYLREEALLADYLVVYTGEVEKVVDGIRIMPWELFLTELWADKLKPVDF